MSNHHVNMSADERALVDETDPHRLAGLDEKALKDLQGRLRRAREKNFDLLRRQGAARVASEGARGAAEPANQKRGDKIDVLDEALARVGERLAAAGEDG